MRCVCSACPALFVTHGSWRSASVHLLGWQSRGGRPAGYDAWLATNRLAKEGRREVSKPCLRRGGSTRGRQAGEARGTRARPLSSHTDGISALRRLCSARGGAAGPRARPNGRREGGRTAATRRRRFADADSKTPIRRRRLKDADSKEPIRRSRARRAAPPPRPRRRRRWPSPGSARRGARRRGT